MISSEIFRMAAAAALTNANELCTEAKLLFEHEHNSRAAALAVIGLEEFAKAVAYAVAAIFPEQSDGIGQRLLNHDVKHWIANTFEEAQIVIEEWPRVIFQDTGSWPPAEEVLVNIFIVLSKSEWGSFVPTSGSAVDHRKNSKPQNKKLIATPFIKNAAFYVDISMEGEVLSPSRVDEFAHFEIGELTRCMDHTPPLLQILSDEKKWKPFAESVRQTPGAHLSIGKDVLTPQKRALRIIKKLPEAATWDQIQKKLRQP